ncbi:MAG TPA: hypothetical protein VFU26_00905 [Gaiellaceae bacterium]|nr:hypothetical protein [Gaiellaceae bacterium]
MSLPRALGVAAADLYHQSWRLLVLNLLLGAVLVAVVLASLAVRPALLLILLLGPAAAAVMHCAVTLAQTEELRLSEVVVGLRRHWRRGLALGASVAGPTTLGAIAIPFYARAGTWAWPLAALATYLLLMFALFQLALWPLAVFEAGRPFRGVVRDAVLIVLRRPLGFAGLALALLIVNAAGIAAAILPFLTLTIAYSFLVSAHFALPKNPAREV